jgi:hypothetical protein
MVVIVVSAISPRVLPPPTLGRIGREDDDQKETND